MTMVARNFELELDESAPVVRQLLSFTMIPKGCACGSSSEPQASLRAFATSEA